MPQDFSRQNLRGRSFKGQELAGANFSNADIRGTNFTGANLQGANFTGAKAGLPLRWAIFLVMISWLLSGLSGILFAYNGFFVSLIFNYPSNESQTLGWTVLIVTIIVFAIIIRQGITAFAVAVAFAVAFAGAVAGAVARTVAGAGTFAFAGAVAGAVAVAIAVAGAFAGAFAGAVAGAVAGAGAVAFAVAVTVAGVVAVAGAVAGAVAVAVAVAGAVAVAVISSYIAWRAMKGDKKYALIRDTAVGLAAIGGTSFRSADLTDANFTSARLKSTDLRKATLTRTCFHKTKLLDRVRPGTSYLKHPYIRQLLTTGQGQDKNFDRLDLRRINLKGTFLTDASFINTDLSETCLQDADLSRAKLVQAQLDATDFTGATLTGAYIEDWNITNETNFRGVRCEYVYMRLPTKENPNPLRKPDNEAEVFTDGEFGDFIQPIFDTLDLYHNQGVDPRAIAVAFKELAEKNPSAELEIVAIEKRGEDKILLRAKTATTANKSELSKEYFINYNQLKALAEKEVQALMSEKDGRIRSLENFVSTALQRPSYYAQRDINMSGDVRNINTDGGNYNEDIEGDYNQNSGISQNMSGGTMYSGMQAAQGDHNNQTMDTNVVSPEQ